MESLGVYLFAGAFCLIGRDFRSGICLAPTIFAVPGPVNVTPSFLLPPAPSSASAPRFRSLLRRAFIIVLPWRDLILVGIQNPQFAGAQPIPQLGMVGHYLGQLFVLRSAIADEARYNSRSSLPLSALSALMTARSASSSSRSFATGLLMFSRASSVQLLHVAVLNEGIGAPRFGLVEHVNAFVNESEVGIDFVDFGCHVGLLI